MFYFLRELVSPYHFFFRVNFPSYPSFKIFFRRIIRISLSSFKMYLLETFITSNCLEDIFGLPKFKSGNNNSFYLNKTMTADSRGRDDKVEGWFWVNLGWEGLLENVDHEQHIEGGKRLVRKKGGHLQREDLFLLLFWYQGSNDLWLLSMESLHYW